MYICLGHFLSKLSDNSGLYILINNIIYHVKLNIGYNFISYNLIIQCISMLAYNYKKKNQYLVPNYKIIGNYYCLHNLYYIPRMHLNVKYLKNNDLQV